MSDKNKGFFLIFVFFFSILFSVRAEIDLAEGVNPGIMCPGATGLYTSIITNTGILNKQYTITTSGSASSFATSVPQGFSLNPGQSRILYTYVSPRSTTSIGTYSLDITASSDEDSKTIRREVSLRDCYSYEISLVGEMQNVCPSDTASYEFIITNTGDYSDTYRLEVEGAAQNWVTLSETTLSLEKGESKSVFAFLSVPVDALGEKDFSLVVDPVNGNSIQSSRALINVEPCFNFDVAPEKDFISLCENSVESIPIAIDNTGSVSNRYALELEGPEWANLDRDNLLIDGGRSDSVNLLLNPGYRDDGDSIITLDVLSDRGEIEATNQFKADVQRCYDVFVSAEKENDKICNSLSNSYSVNIKNTGKFNNDFQLALDGPEWASLDRGLVSLDSDEESSLTLEVNPPFDAAAGEYPITVKAASVDSDKIESEDTITITTVTREECFKPSIGIEEAKKKISVFYDSAATLPVVIENKGSVAANYILGVSGTAANFVQLNPAAINIEPNKAEIVYLYIAPGTQTALGDYSASISVRLEDTTILASDTISISVLEAQKGDGVIVPETIEEEKKVTPGFWRRVSRFFRNLFGPQAAPEQNITIEENISAIEEISEEEEIVNLDIEGKITQSLGENDSSNFTLNEEEHSLNVDELSEEGITLRIESEPVFVRMELGETKDVDLDGDGVNELRITYNGIVNGKADLTYEKIIEEAEIPEEIIEEIPENMSEEIEEIPENISEEIEEMEEEILPEIALKEFTIEIKDYQLSLDTIEVNEGDRVKLTLVALDNGEGNGYGFEINDFGVSELLEEGQNITVEFTTDKQGSFAITNSIPCETCGKDLAGNIVVKAPGEITKKEEKKEEQASENFFITYRNYIIAGVIILIIIILLISTKAHKKVIEFFEEEVEEEEKKEKKETKKEVNKEVRKEHKEEKKEEEHKEEKKDTKKEKKKPKSEDDYY